MTPTDILRAMLDERSIEHFDHETGEPLRDLSEAGTDPATSWRMDGASVCAVPNKHGTFDLWIDNCTPEHAIAATVGYREQAEWDEWLEDHNGVHEWHSPRVHPPKVIELHFSDGITRFVPEYAATVGDRTDLARQLREVYGLHTFAELFGFSWEDGSDWTWHDVACAMADAVDAATVGAGTCKNTQDDFDFMCSECGKCVDNGRVLGFKFCPQCGRKIKEEAE